MSSSSSSSARPRSASSAAAGAPSQEERESDAKPAERILITSSGPSCEYQHYCLGEYQLVSYLLGSYKKAPRYKQRCGIYELFKGDAGWQISEKIGDRYSIYLRNLSNSPTLPLSGWECRPIGDSRFVADPSLWITSEIPQPCLRITITVNKTETRAVPDLLGYFLPTDEYKNGRPVYRNEDSWGRSSRLVGSNYHGYGWEVMNGYSHARIRSASSTGSPCPADPRNSYSQRLKWNSWRYWSGSSDWRENNIVVTCDQHHYDNILLRSQIEIKEKKLVENIKTLLGQQLVTEIVRRGDITSTVIRLILYILCVDIRPSLEEEFPRDQYKTINTIMKVITYLKDIVQSGSSSVSRDRRSRLFITGHQGCGKSSLIHYLRYKLNVRKTLFNE